MEELKNLKETILAIQKYSQEVVDAKGALKRDKILAQGAVYAYDKVLYYIKEIEQEKLQAQLVVTDKNDWKSGFHHGYTQALEDSKEKKYTEEDMITAFEKGTNAGALSERLYDYDNGDYEEAPQYYKQQKESFIQSLQPKTEWEVTFDEQGKLRLV